MPVLSESISRWQKFVLVVVLSGCLLFFYDTGTPEEIPEIDLKEGTGATKQQRSSSKACASTCTLQSDVKRFGGDLLKTDDLLRLVNTQRDVYIAQLKQDYGAETYHNVFEFNNTISRGRNSIFRAANPEGPSWERMKHKLLMKVLKMQMAVEQERDKRTECGCDGRRRLQQPQTTAPHNNSTADASYSSSSSSKQEFGTTNSFPDVDEQSPFYARYVWVNGGHSASAGHGNFYRESYTAHLERSVKRIFSSIGIDFVGKNYAMGGTASAPEVALCSQSIFGTDIDSLTWDYGMTDGDAVWRLLLYAYHAAQAPSRPALIGLGIVGHGGRRHLTLQVMEDLGMTSFLEDDAVWRQMVDAIPDTFGKTDEEIAQMPPYARYFRCENQVEKGDPGCGTEKFNSTYCVKRKFKTSWHPGWKHHALTGNSLALFIVEVLRDALAELGSLSKQERHDLYIKLDAVEEADYRRIFESPIPESMQKEIKGNHILDVKDIDDVDVEILFKKKSFCHSAILPAEIRYRGILTETDQVGFFTYDKGVSSSVIQKAESAGNLSKYNNTDKPGEMILSYSEKERQDCKEEYVNLDYKDYFRVSSREGWRSLTLPNESEEKYYNINTTKFQGLILVCLAGCDWGKCDPQDVHKQFADGPVQFLVNDEKVVHISPVNNDCFMLKGPTGHHWKTNSHGKYVIKARLAPEEYKWVWLSSFILI